MSALLRGLAQFLRGIAAHWIGALGVGLTTSAFVLFVLAELLRLIGLLTNAYVGLITYMALPALFVFGLLLIPIGWWRYRKRRARSTGELLRERFPSGFTLTSALGSRLFLVVAGLTLANLLFLGAGSARMLRFMDTPEFCGTACHSVMGPEWAVYQASPHARVRCVDCHVGQSAEAQLDAKLNGLWQMISLTFDLHERPIPTPVHNLRPARETCERCHWPDKFYGDRIKVIARHADDVSSTPRYTTLALKVGSGAGARRGEIHWHVAAQNQVRYQADTARERMQWVEVTQDDGSVRRFMRRDQSADAPGYADAHGIVPPPRLLDCVDCHNRATHIYQDPEHAVDALLVDGSIDRAIPYAARRARAALRGSYGSLEVAMAGIEVELRHGLEDGAAAALWQPTGRAIDALREVYRRNIHPHMGVGWNPYPDHIGHRGGGGCFRCHDRELVDEDGVSISADCTLCHSMLAYDSPAPYHFVREPAEDAPDRQLHLYLRDELRARQHGE